MALGGRGVVRVDRAEERVDRARREAELLGRRVEVGLRPLAVRLAVVVALHRERLARAGLAVREHLARGVCGGGLTRGEASGRRRAATDAELARAASVLTVEL